ncbi:MAG TPA: YqgE/AlgH family protein [Xanthobacteraceae bacterium]|jgi:putative transcriptional regulator|nr:YqgE/AlgH family protein [Xanthobacteraceae bacterium]
MQLTWFERPLLALAAIVLPATLLHAALQNPAEAPGPASLAGQVLIASPTLRDPRFDHTVVLMVRHNAGGALGIVLNHPVGERQLASLLDAIGEKDSMATGTLRIFSGGPVQPEVGFVIHSTDYRRPETVEINGSVAMTSSREILRDIASQHGPEKMLVAFGYAGWAGGQLEGELAQRAWFTATADSKLIFDLDRDKVWGEAMAHHTQDL